MACSCCSLPVHSPGGVGLIQHLQPLLDLPSPSVLTPGPSACLARRRMPASPPAYFHH